MTYKIKTIGIIIVYTLLTSCKRSEISDIFPIGSKLTDSILITSQQIFLYENHVFLKGDLSDQTGKFYPYILLFDKNLILKSAVPFSSNRIDSIVNDTIYHVRSDYVSNWYSRGQKSFDRQFTFKATKSTPVEEGFNICNKMVKSLSINPQTGKLKIVFLESALLTEGVGVEKDKYSDSSFVKKFSSEDSVTISIGNIMFDFKKGILKHTFLDRGNSRIVFEKMIIPSVSIGSNLFEGIITKGNIAP